MNKNTKARKTIQHKANKSAGFAKPVYKRRKNPYPQPKDAGIPLIEQRRMFYGADFIA